MLKLITFSYYEEETIMWKKKDIREMLGFYFERNSCSLLKRDNFAYI